MGLKNTFVVKSNAIDKVSSGAADQINVVIEIPREAI